MGGLPIVIILPGPHLRSLPSCCQHSSYSWVCVRNIRPGSKADFIIAIFLLKKGEKFSGWITWRYRTAACPDLQNPLCVILSQSWVENNLELIKVSADTHVCLLTAVFLCWCAFTYYSILRIILHVVRCQANPCHSNFLWSSDISLLLTMLLHCIYLFNIQNSEVDSRSDGSNQGVTGNSNDTYSDRPFVVETYTPGQRNSSYRLFTTPIVIIIWNILKESATQVIWRLKWSEPSLVSFQSFTGQKKNRRSKLLWNLISILKSRWTHFKCILHSASNV